MHNARHYKRCAIKNVVILFVTMMNRHIYHNGNYFRTRPPLKWHSFWRNWKKNVTQELRERAKPFCSTYFVLFCSSTMYDDDTIIMRSVNNYKKECKTLLFLITVDLVQIVQSSIKNLVFWKWNVSPSIVYNDPR